MMMMMIYLLIGVYPCIDSCYFNRYFKFYEHPFIMISEEAKKGNYGTVVVGRRGANRAHFFGGVSRYVTERITDRALWLFPITHK